MHEARHLSVYIARPPDDVYEFASDPKNLPQWAAGLARSQVRRENGEWAAESPFGKVWIKFAERNRLGVMDHDVRMEAGGIVHIPMRVVPNGDGSEFVLTLIRPPGMSDEKFAEDKAAVEKDLRTLKALLESRSDEARPK